MAPDTQTSTPTGAIARELAGVVLIVLAVVGVSVAAFAQDWRLGLFVVSLAAGAVGWFLSTGRE